MPKIILEDLKIKKIKKPQTLQEKDESVVLNTSKIKKEATLKLEKDFDFLSKKIQSKNVSNKNETLHQNKRIYSTPRIKKRIIDTSKIKILFILSFIFSILFLVGTIFHSSRVTISPKEENIDFKNKIFNADKKDFVDFEIMIAGLKKEKTIILTDAKEVSNKASGSIVLFNEFSTKNQTITAGTYISDHEGKTYKTNKTVSIPGYKKINNKIIPGQIEIGITSFLAGENYNGTPEKFYINSFKGTTKYGKIYGKLKDPLVGGKQGLVYYLNEEDKNKIKEIAENSFKQDLFKQVQSLTPDKYVLYKGATNFEYKFDESILSENPETKIEIEGKLSAVLLKEDSFRENIIKQMLPDVKKEDMSKINLGNINNLDFSFGNNNEIIKKDMSRFSFIINGSLKAVWNPDQDKIKKELASIKKEDSSVIFRSNIGISKASLRIFPFWKNTNPSNPSKIYIKIK